MKKVRRNILAPSTTGGAQPNDFFQLCGSPIRVDVKLNYDDLEDEYEANNHHYEASPATPPSPMTPVTPMTPPFPGLSASPQRPLTQQHAESPSPHHHQQQQQRSGEESMEMEDGEPEEKRQEKTSPLSLAKAQQAGIPCFMAAQYESKTELPSAAGAGGSSSSSSSPFPSHAKIPMRDLSLTRLLGEGAFGKVYQARWKSKRVAVKLLIHQNLSDDVAREFEKEVKIMSYLHHPNICRLLGACLDPPHRALVVELVERGCLWNVLRANRRQLTQEIRSKMVLDIARGMHYLHGFERPILHRDMKSPNLLVDKEFAIKISDFGLARVKAQIQTMTGNCGTVQWMAPEVLGNRKYTEKADVYSFGIVVWEIFTGRCPYDGMTQIQAALSVLNHDLRPSIPTSCPRFFARLIKMCWTRDPEARPSFEHIVRMYEHFFHVDAKDE